MSPVIGQSRHRPAAQLVGVGLLILAGGAAPATAAELRGKVTAVTGQSVRIEMEGELVPQVGDLVRLSFRIPGGPEVPVGQWRVSAVSASGVEATVVQASGAPTVGQTATIDSANPTRRAATRPEGEVAGTPDSRALSTPSGASLLDITDRDIESQPSGPSGRMRFDGAVLSIQAPSMHDIWYRLSREPAQSYRVTAELRVVGSGPGRGRRAGIFLSHQSASPAGSVDEGAVYVGIGHYGANVEVRRYERPMWQWAADVPSRRPASDVLVIERARDRYTVQVNGVTVARVDAVPGQADWVRLYLDASVHAELSAWTVERLP